MYSIKTVLKPQSLCLTVTAANRCFVGLPLSVCALPGAGEGADASSSELDILAFYFCPHSLFLPPPIYNYNLVTVKAIVY